MQQIHKLSERVIEEVHSPFDLMKFVFAITQHSENLQQKAWLRYQSFGCPPLKKFSPYVAFIVMIEAFFYFAKLKGLISKERITNKIDFAYLYYLPFCNIFISTDKLHQRVAPIFIDEDQLFV